MKIAIHHRKGSFSERWIEYCKKNKIPYKIVNAYDTDIITQLSDCDAFMWHIVQWNFRDMLFGRQLLYSVAKSGKKIFPNFDTVWHFDDKIGQKYLLESLKVPFVTSYVFYSKESAFQWIDQTTFPKVFKLSGGAGSYNVKLIKNKNQARRVVKKAFSSGFSPISRWENFREHIRKIKSKKESPLVGLAKGLFRLFIQWDYLKMFSKVKGYVYFQDFIPANEYDIRVVVTGDKAFAIKRLVRENDFRASGSGKIIYDKNEIDIRCIQLSFEVNKHLNSQSVAYDYVFDKENNPLLVEISYCYVMKGYDPCPGYWDQDLNWYPESFKPQYWQVENILNS